MPALRLAASDATSAGPTSGEVWDDGFWSFGAFAELKGTNFSVGNSALRLIAVERRTQDPRLNCYTLRWQGALDAELPEGTHCLDHPRRPRTDLFIRPGRIEAGKIYYHATICRLRPAFAARLSRREWLRLPRVFRALKGGAA